MSKNGFLTLRRCTAKERDAEDRLNDWDAFHPAMDTMALREQAERCMNCGTPFCHGGVVWNGVSSGCTLGNLIPEWNDLVTRGLDREAYLRLSRTSPFSEFTSRVCPALCEGACTSGLNGQPVTVREIERYLSDEAWEKGWIEDITPEKPSGYRVAVVGSGPAGLSAAYELRRAGHDVTVYEKSDRPGGLLQYGIPNMKLPKEIVSRRTDWMKAQGIRFVCDAAVGQNITVDELNGYDAVVISAGAGQPRDLDVPGRQLEGVSLAVPYLAEATRTLQEGKIYTTLRGKRAVVIGGGDTGNDCVATVLRQGALDVVQLEIMPSPPDMRADSNPWPQWPMVRKTDYGQQEAIHLLGRDPREYCVQTTSIEGKDGHVAAINTERVEWVMKDGRRVPQPIPGTQKRIETDLVLLAMGFMGPEQALVKALGLTQTRAFALGNNSWFAAGDFRTGQSLVVKAIRDGMDAAMAVEKFLQEK